MKKAIALVLAAMMLFTTAFAADDVLIFDNVNGDNQIEVDTDDIIVIDDENGGSLFEFANPEITRIAHMEMRGMIIDTTERGSILVQNHMNEEDRVVLHIGEDTLVIDAETGAITTLDERTTEFVNVYYSAAMTRSLPPQSTAAAIIVNCTENQFKPYYKVVDYVEQAENGIRVLTDVGSLYVTIGSETELSHFDGREIAVSDIIAGDELLVWYDFVAMSYPGQTYASKAVVVRNAPENLEFALFGEGNMGNVLTLSADAGIAAIGGAEIDLWGVNYTDAGQPTFPLRQISEALGFTVKWFEGTKQVTISNDEILVAFEFNSTTLVVNGVIVELDYAPTVYGDTTYVTADFFITALGVTAEVLGTGV